MAKPIGMRVEKVNLIPQEQARREAQERIEADRRRRQPPPAMTGWALGDPSPDLPHATYTVRDEEGKGWDVCHLFGTGQEPHAKLIVAAPKLLAHLEAVVRCAEWIDADADDDPDGGWWSATINKEWMEGIMELCASISRECGHCVCTQNFIDTGDRSCIER